MLNGTTEGLKASTDATAVFHIHAQEMMKRPAHFVQARLHQPRRLHFHALGQHRAVMFPRPTASGTGRRPGSARVNVRSGESHQAFSSQKSFAGVRGKSQNLRNSSRVGGRAKAEREKPVVRSNHEQTEIRGQQPELGRYSAFGIQPGVG